MTKSMSTPIPTLHISGGSLFSEEQFWPVTKSMLIGRENADILITLPSLSRHHAEVAVNGTSIYTIQDLHSKNGTAVNGVFLNHEPCLLAHGDVIVLAGAVELRFNDPNATPFSRTLGQLTGLWIDPVDQEIWIDAEKLIPPLSHAQLKLLQMIVDANGAIVSKDEMIKHLWPDHDALTLSDDAVDSLIKRLRRRLAGIEHGNAVLEVVRGRGLRLKRNRPTNRSYD